MIPVSPLSFLKNAIANLLCFVAVIADFSITLCTTEYVKVNGTLLCRPNQAIDIKRVSVGYSLLGCDFTYCPRHFLNRTNRYYLYLENECLTKSQCLVSTVILFKNFSSDAFDVCGYGGSARNTVKVDYRCLDRRELIIPHL